MKQNRIQKCAGNEISLPVSTQIVSNKKITKSKPFDLPGLDFSERRHQAIFWMLLNTVIAERSGNSARFT